MISVMANKNRMNEEQLRLYQLICKQFLQLIVERFGAETNITIGDIQQIRGHEIETNNARYRALFHTRYNLTSYMDRVRRAVKFGTDKYDYFTDDFDDVYQVRWVNDHSFHLTAMAI